MVHEQPPRLAIAGRHIKRLRRRLDYLNARIIKATTLVAAGLDSAEAKAIEAALNHIATCPCAKHRPKETQVCAPVKSLA